MERRTVIADAAITLVAESGLRALTHRALDSVADLPAGSTSYYFRTKADVVAAMIERITRSSASSFESITAVESKSACESRGAASGDPADVTVAYLQHLLDTRADHLRARHALVLDPSVETDVRRSLAVSLFSLERARELLGDPAMARGFVALCEGLVLTALSDGWTEDSLRIPVVTYLAGAGLRE